MNTRLQGLINYTFKDKSILNRALTHKSKINESSNEVLEFLGDRVLSLIISEKLIEMYPFDREGILDKKLSNLVDKNACLKIAQKIDLMEFIILGSTEIQSEGNQKKSILSNCCEALIGAIYEDGGYDEAKKFVLLFWDDLFKSLDLKPIDPKSALQEKLLKKYKKLPIYETVSKSGPDHSPVFCIEVSFENYISAKAEASTVKEAEKLAATNFIESNKI
jgi:ribonuclease-3